MEERTMDNINIKLEEGPEQCPLLVPNKTGFDAMNYDDITSTSIIEKIKQLKLQVEALTGKTIEELATEPQAMVVTLADISKEAGWDCYNCAAKGGEWCDELQMALYGGCPMFEMK
jgi:hypothetical protein